MLQFLIYFGSSINGYYTYLSLSIWRGLEVCGTELADCIVNLETFIMREAAPWNDELPEFNDSTIFKVDVKINIPDECFKNFKWIAYLIEVGKPLNDECSILTDYNNKKYLWPVKDMDVIFEMTRALFFVNFRP